MTKAICTVAGFCGHRSSALPKQSEHTRSHVEIQCSRETEMISPATRRPINRTLHSQVKAPTPKCRLKKNSPIFSADFRSTSSKMAGQVSVVKLPQMPFNLWGSVCPAVWYPRINFGWRPVRCRRICANEAPGLWCLRGENTSLAGIWGTIVVAPLTISGRPFGSFRSGNSAKCRKPLFLLDARCVFRALRSFWPGRGGRAQVRPAHQR
ncbi:hypothetical protein MALG_03195 [Marinovum algicola DG 898]|nr:hypothetical protein MALG_03195 [Marinovum algicola DG 898]